MIGVIVIFIILLTPPFCDPGISLRLRVQTYRKKHRFTDSICPALFSPSLPNWKLRR